MSEGDWRDPFSDDDDEAARERARRRAEREARRRGRRREVADRVREQAERAEATPNPPATREPPEEPEPPEPPRPPTREEPAIPGEGHPPEQAEAPAEPGEAEPVPPRRASLRRGQGPRSGVIVRRRLGAIALLVAAAGLVLFGAATVADRIGGGDGDEEAPAAEPEPLSVTIPEGFDRQQVAAIARDAGLRGNYPKASKEAKGFKPGRFGAEGPDSLEGFLFPATYELRPNSHVNGLIQRQLDAFRDQIKQVNMREAESRNLTVYDVLKIASMIDREVQVPKERKLVSAVIYNRLEAGTPLGIDATIRYEDQNFEEPLTESRLAEPTPYNTRVNAGLPPTPIGNPGLASIRAAANPADVDHFYFVVKPNTCGEHFFTASEEEFNNAAARYQRELKRQGGAPTPDDC